LEVAFYNRSGEKPAIPEFGQEYPVQKSR